MDQPPPGQGFYPDSFGNGTFIIQESNATTGKPLRGGATFNVTLDYSTILLIDAPDGALAWAQWSVFTAPWDIQIELGIGWGSRVDTIGGATPTNCSAANKDKVVIIPYNATYNFYPCPSRPGTATSQGWTGRQSTIGALVSILFALMLFK